MSPSSERYREAVGGAAHSVALDLLRELDARVERLSAQLEEAQELARVESAAADLQALYASGVVHNPECTPTLVCLRCRAEEAERRLRTLDHQMMAVAKDDDLPEDAHPTLEIIQAHARRMARLVLTEHAAWRDALAHATAVAHAALASPRE